MRRARGASVDHAAHHVAVALLGGKIDRWRRALFAAADVAQVHRLTEPAMRFADQQDSLALGLERECCGFAEIIEQPDAADRRGREDAAAVSLVVKRDVT